MAFILIVTFLSIIINHFPPRLTKTSCYFTLSNARWFYCIKKSLVLGGKGLTGPISSSLLLNHFPPRLTKVIPFCYFILSNARQFYNSCVGKGYKERSNFYILLYLNSYVEKQYHLDIIIYYDKYRIPHTPLGCNHDNISYFGPWEFVKHYASDRIIFVSAVNIVQL